MRAQQTSLGSCRSGLEGSFARGGIGIGGTLHIGPAVLRGEALRPIASIPPAGACRPNGPAVDPSNRPNHFDPSLRLRHVEARSIVDTGEQTVIVRPSSVRNV